MPNRETSIAKRIWLAASRLGYVLFRNQVGAGWTGDWTRLDDGSVLIRKPRFIKYGLFVGSGDYIGWKRVTITPDMVGQTLPIFASVEVKTDRGRPNKDQRKWHENLQRAGAVTLVARSEDDVQ